jgi:twitching motility protein PilT
VAIHRFLKRFRRKRLPPSLRHIFVPYDNDLARLVADLNRSAPSTRTKEQARTFSPEAAGSIDALLAQGARGNASDVLIVTGASAAMRINGALNTGNGPALSADDVSGMLLPVMGAARYEELQRNRSVDFCFVRPEIGRFRANVHYQRGTLAASIRLLPAQIPTVKSLRLPDTLEKLVERRQGLVVVTGPTGCGKSSTLAALINLINEKRRGHIVTIEDPIEYQYANRNCIVEQIEVGHDAPGFATALRSILRQSPDVILVGEMRDPETIQAVLTAAETGHLVFSTLHTNDAPQTISRIVDSFPVTQQSQVRLQVSLALLAVVAQQLVPAADDVGRYPALEIMVATDAVRNLIRKGEDHQLRSQISVGRADGAMTMEQSLGNLMRLGHIRNETALAHCFRPEDLRHYTAG